MNFILLVLLFGIQCQDYSDAISRNLTVLLNTDQNKAVVTGKITDTDGSPLSYATVFIANSTLGSISDETGIYEIKNVPFGQHVLVVSYVGYETYKKSININNVVMEQNVVLGSSMIELEVIEIIGRKSKNKWKSNYRKFKNCFLGTTTNALECKILNPEVLRFHYDTESKILKATANEMLIIENKALGYKIQYVLEVFELMDDGSNIYLGKVKFEPLVPKNEHERQKWYEFRRIAYYGSFRHFLSSLNDNNLRKEGFLVLETNKIIPYAKKSRDENRPDPQYGNGGKFVSGNLKKEYEKYFHFSADYLHIRYVFESEMLRAMGNQRTMDEILPYQESWIEKLSPRIVFHTEGYLYKPQSVMVYGYWAKEKIAEALPLDYFPVDVINLYPAQQSVF